MLQHLLSFSLEQVKTRDIRIRKELRKSMKTYGALIVSIANLQLGALYLDELLCITKIGVPAWKSIRLAIVGLKSFASTRRL